MKRFIHSLIMPALLAASASGAAMAQTHEPAQLKQREELILAQPTRIKPPAEITEEMRRLALPPPGYGRPGELPEHYLIMLHTPELLKAYSAIGTYFLVHGKMNLRDREMVILRVAWLTQAPYEWGEHVKIGKERAGLTSDDVARAQTGSSAAGLSDHDRALLKAVEELFQSAMISDATWEQLEKSMTREQLIELPVLIGQYQTTAFLLNSLRIRLRQGNVGLTAK